MPRLAYTSVAALMAGGLVAAGADRVGVSDPLNGSIPANHDYVSKTSSGRSRAAIADVSDTFRLIERDDPASVLLRDGLFGLGNVYQHTVRRQQELTTSEKSSGPPAGRVCWPWTLPARTGRLM